jgi:hypothetical protein
LYIDFVYRSLTESSSEPTVSSKPGLWFVFPPYPGKTWDNEYTWETVGAASVQGKAEEHGKALGWEDVTVPAIREPKSKVATLYPKFGRRRPN